jgi:predicted enzyme related to lactoylglutathione lyase
MTGGRTRVTGIDASYYYVKDFDRAVKFYEEMLGQGPSVAYPGMFAEWTFDDGQSFGLYKSECWEPGTGIMFAVPDVHEAVTDLRSRGVEIDDRIEDTPACFMAFGKDTEGNSFIIHHRKA